MLLRRLNEHGISLFGNYIDELRSTNATIVPPRGLLDRPDTSVTIRPSLEIDSSPLETRLEAARRVDDLISPLPSNIRSQLETDPGFWSWLSLYYFDSVCPSVKGKRKPYASYRHLFDSEDRTGKYRHLLASPYVIYKQLYPAYRRGMAVLQGPVHTPGEVVEQIVGRNDLIGNPHVVEAYTNLYFDTSNNSIKYGAAGRRSGCANRFGTLLNQFDRTYDLGSMSATQIVDLLPSPEFDRYR